MNKFKGCASFIKEIWYKRCDRKFIHHAATGRLADVKHRHLFLIKVSENEKKQVFIFFENKTIFFSHVHKAIYHNFKIHHNLE